MHKLNDLKIWHEAIELAFKIYSTTECFPDQEKFGLISQMRRAAVSIASNISEGAGRNSNKEFNNFIGYANGSSFELQTQVILSQKMQFISAENATAILDHIDKIQKMSFNLQKRLNWQR
jgi:four helix bundle protein